MQRKEEMTEEAWLMILAEEGCLDFGLERSVGSSEWTWWKEKQECRVYFGSYRKLLLMLSIRGWKDRLRTTGWCLRSILLCRPHLVHFSDSLFTWCHGSAPLVNRNQELPTLNSHSKYCRALHRLRPLLHIYWVSKTNA